MAWVYCSYCGQRGHNRLGCPKRKRDAAAEPEGYTARQLAREAETRKRAVASRTCSYCDLPGHNRRGCKTLKEDKKLILQRQKNYMEEFLDACDNIGLGPGSLIRVPRGDRHDPFSKEVLLLVTDFNWSNVDFLNSDVDPNKSWGIKNRRILKARVVASKGWGDTSYNSWNGPPEQNSLAMVTQSELCHLLPECLSRPQGHHPADTVQLVGPAHGAFKVPEVEITSEISDHFNLYPKKRADDFDKRRKFLGAKEWQFIYPEEHEKAREELQNNS